MDLTEGLETLGYINTGRKTKWKKRNKTEQTQKRMWRMWFSLRIRIKYQKNTTARAYRIHICNNDMDEYVGVYLTNKSN